MNANWYEIWADEGLDVPYLLLLRPIGDRFEILDPAEGNRRVFETKNYDDARMWLLEDEYVSVGRKELDDP